MKKALLIKLLLILPSIASAQENSALTTVNAVTDNICRCLEWPYTAMSDATEDVRQAQINGNFSKIQAVQNSLLSITQSAESCIIAVMDKYPSIDQSLVLQEKVLEKLEGQCPSPM